MVGCLILMILDLLRGDKVEARSIVKHAVCCLTRAVAVVD